MSSRQKVARVVVALAVALGVGAVAGIDAPVAGAARSAARSNVLTVTAGENVCKLQGAPKAGWIRINFDNAGTEYHVMAVAQIKPSVTTAQLKAALLSGDPKAGQDLLVGDGTVGPMPGFLGPGQKSGIITKMAPGTYAIRCSIPAGGGSSGAADEVKIFKVAKGKSTLKPPRAGVIEVDVNDTGTTIPATLPAKGYLDLTNSGTTTRSLGTALLQPGATAAQAESYFDALFSATPPTGAPPAVMTGGVQGLPKGLSVFMVLQLNKGSYVYSSSNSDLQNGDPNPVLGQFAVN